MGALTGPLPIGKSRLAIFLFSPLSFATDISPV
jgi:hypothetical protein